MQYRFVTETVSEIRAAFGQPWYGIGAPTAAVIGALDWISGNMGWPPMTHVLGIPSWVLGSLIFAALTTFGALRHAVRLRRLVTPRFQLSFEREGNGIAAAMERFPGSQEGYQSVYVRVTARTLTEVPVPKCAAFISEVAYRKNHQDGFSEIKLPQPISLVDKPFKIHPGIPHYIDFLVGVRGGEKDAIGVIKNWPNILSGRIGDPGFYKFKISVVSKHGTLHQTVEVNWNGSIDTIDALAV